MASANPSFTLTVINNTWTFGPIQPQLCTLDEVNLTNHRIRDLILGTARLPDKYPSPIVFTFVDVRDVARAHVRAMLVPCAAGQRFLIAAFEHYSNKRIADIIRKRYPWLKSQLPQEEKNDDLPSNVTRLDNKKSIEVLGMEYRALEETVRDTVVSMLPLLEKTYRQPGENVECKERKLYN